jgi:homoaconitase/3-isopropylmalate dehydratase large subunit
MGMSFAEKILAEYAGLKDVIPSQIVTVHPDHLLTHDNTAAVIQKIQPELEKYGVYSKSLSVIVLDHVIPASSEKTATNHKVIRDFVRKHGVENFFFYSVVILILVHMARLVLFLQELIGLKLLRLC